MDTINSLLGNKFSKNCEKFSLKDKAHLRNLIQELEKKMAKQKRKLGKEAKEKKKLNQEYKQALGLLNQLNEAKAEDQRISELK